MALTQSKRRLSREEFLAWDATQTVRHEFIDGDIVARQGASDSHVTAAGNVAIALRRHLDGTPYRTFISDMKLEVRAVGAFFYPDVLVTCSAADSADAMIKREPVLLVEVLSPSTAAFDRGDKLEAYRSIDTLREYLLVDPDKRRADLYRLGADGLWVLHPFDVGSTVQLASVQLDIAPAALWAEVPPVEQA